MAGFLNCATEYKVFITGRCGSPRLCEVLYATDITWGRTIDNISTAQVKIAMPTAANSDPCCDCYAKVEPWCHELQIFRNQDFVWTGPITKITYGYETVTIDARDVLAWLDVRFIPGFIGFGIQPTGVGQSKLALGTAEITDIAAKIIELATKDQENSSNTTCVFENIIQYKSTFTNTSFSKQAFEETAFTMLQDLAKMGLDFTAFGRSIILSGFEQFQTPNLKVLTSEMILGEIEVSKDGDGYGNDFFMNYFQSDQLQTCTTNNPGVTALTVPCPVEVSSANQYCHSLVQRKKDDAGSYLVDTARQMGQRYVDAVGQQVPVTINFPADTTLSPSTPWEINDMIPGMLVNVTLSGLCLPVFQTFRLTDVKVTISADQDEKVGISLSPTNTLTGSL